MSETIEFPSVAMPEFTVSSAIPDEELKRLPPLFYHEDEALESELLILKLVSLDNHNHEVYLYEHDGISLYSAMMVLRGEKEMRFAFDLATIGVVEEPRFAFVSMFKPRTVHELLLEGHNAGAVPLAVESEEIQAELGILLE